MAKAKKIPLKRDYVQIPNETAQAVQINAGDDAISLQALGLIVNLWSYNVDEWDLHKTELYKRYAKNKETSVRNAWKELIDNRYIVEYKFRDGKRWEYVYAYRIEPFDDQEVLEIVKDGIEEYGQIYTLDDKVWELDFQDPKIGTSFSGPQNHDISNTLLTESIIKEKYYQSNLSIYNDEIEILDLPDEIKDVLKKHIDRLISDQIEPKDIFRNFKANKKQMDQYQYAEVLQTVLAYSKDKIGSISSYMNTAIKRYLAPAENKTPAPSKNKDIVPDWYTRGDHKKKPIENPEPGKMTEEQKRVAEQLKKYKEGVSV